MTLTESQIRFLHVMTLHPDGIVVRHPDGIKDMKALATTGYISDAFERGGGEWSARITKAGREAFAETQSGSPTQPRKRA